MRRILILFFTLVLFSCEKEKLSFIEGVSTLAADTNSSVWFMSNLGLTRYMNQSWTNFSLADQGIAMADITGFYTKGNDFYILTNFGYVQYVASASVILPLTRVDKASAGFLSDTMLQMKTIGARNFVITTRNFSVLQNNQWFHQRDSLITGFDISNDTCYVATRGWGVSRYILNVDGFTGASAYQYGYGCLINDTVHAVLIAKNRTQWYGTQDGVFFHPEFDSKSYWQQFGTADGLPDKKVYMLMEDSQGRIWAATEKGVSFYNGSTWSSFSTPKVTAMKEDKNGTVWIGTVQCLVSYNGSWNLYTTAEGLAGNKITAVSPANDGSVWFGTDKGATQYVDGVFKKYLSITQNEE